MQTTSTKFTSYSANNEDVLLNRLYGNRNNGFFVDVGAAHPIFENDTKALSDRGWTGINIEPNIGFYRELVAQRPRDRNLNFAVSDEPGVITWHEVVGTGLSTCDQDEAKRAGDRGFQVIAKLVETCTLRQILEEAAPSQIDLLKVDVEGFELKVLMSNDWKRFRPRLIMTEATFPETPVRRPDGVTPFLEKQGYRCVYFDGLNDYFIEQNEDIPSNVFDCPVNVFDNFVPYVQALLTRERDSLTHDVAVLTAERCNFETSITSLKSVNADLETGLKCANEKLSELSHETAELIEERSRLNACVASLRSVNADLEIDLKRTNQELSKIRREITALINERDQLNVYAASLVSANTEFENDLKRKNQELASLMSANTEFESDLKRKNQELSLLHSKISALHMSTSWRITRPLRALSRPRRTIKIILGRT